MKRAAAGTFLNNRHAWVGLAEEDANVKSKSVHLGRTILTLLAVVFAILLGSIPMLVRLRGSADVRARGFDAATMDFDLLGIAQPLYVALLLLPFAIGLATLVLICRWLHGRTFTQLTTGHRGRWSWIHFAWGFGIWLGAWLCVTGIDMVSDPEGYDRVFEGPAFAKTLPVVLVLLPLQVLFEECVLRGYLFQQMVSWTQRPWLSVVAIALLFALLHNNLTSEATSWWASGRIYYFGVGLLLGIVTLVDDGLELAFGLHIAANLTTALLVNFPSAELPTPSLFVALEQSFLRSALILAIASAACGWLLWHRARAAADHNNPVPAYTAPLP